MGRSGSSRRSLAILHESMHNAPNFSRCSRLAASRPTVICSNRELVANRPGCRTAGPAGRIFYHKPVEQPVDGPVRLMRTRGTRVKRVAPDIPRLIEAVLVA